MDNLLTTDEQYFAFDAINSSRLKEATKSMKHFFEYEPKPATDAMKLGTALHEYVLQYSTFWEKYEVFEKPFLESNMNKKENRAALNEIINAGKIPISEGDFKSIEGMHRALKDHPKANELFFDDGVVEKEQGFWWEHESGLKLKIKPDSIWCSMTERMYGADLKKRQDASDRGFLKGMKSFQDEIQAALYSMGLQQRFGDRFNRFYFVLVEEKRSHKGGHEVGLYYLPDAYIETVQAWINETLWQIHEIKAKGLPVYGYSNPDIDKGLVEIFPPDWMWNKYAKI